MDRKLLQKDVAQQIGVLIETIAGWEKNKRSPQHIHYPKIVDFLGYCPYQRIDGFGEFLKAMRIYRLGLCRRELAKQLGVDDSTIRLWEDSARKRMNLRTRQILWTFLEKQCRNIPFFEIFTLDDPNPWL